MKPQLFVRPTKPAPATFATDPRPRVRILKTGVIILNAAAREQLQLPAADPELVFYWYADLGQIGMRRALADDPEGARFAASATEQSSAPVLRFKAKPLFQHHNVDLAKAAGDYPLGQDLQNHLRIFTLPKGCCPVMVDRTAVSSRLSSVRPFRGEAVGHG